MSIINKEDVTKRMLSAMKAKKLTYERLAGEINKQFPLLNIKSYQVYESIINGRYNSTYFPFIAKALGQSMEYLTWGQRDLVSVIGWDDVRQWKTSDKYLPIITQNPKARALKLIDDSMKTIFIDTPTFPSDTYIIAYPAHKAEIGDFVIAVLDDDVPPVFRRLMHDKKRNTAILKSLNPYFPDHDFDDEINIKAIVKSSYNEV